MAAIAAAAVTEQALARALGQPNRAARWVGMFRMGVRIGWCVWVATTFFGGTMFRASAIAAVAALVVIVLLWSSSVREYSAR